MRELGYEDSERVKKCAAFQQMDLQSDLLQFSESLGSPIFSASTFHPISYWNLFLFLSLLATLIEVFIFSKEPVYAYFLVFTWNLVNIPVLMFSIIRS